MISFIVFLNVLLRVYMNHSFKEWLTHIHPKPKIIHKTSKFSPSKKHKVVIKIIRVYTFEHNIQTTYYPMNLHIQINKSM